jgi:predicted MFS family arabinose efflux permease
MFIWVIIAWMFPPAQASRVLAIAPENPPLALSLNYSALYLGVALGPMIGGQILAHIGLVHLGWLGASFPLLGLKHQRPPEGAFDRLTICPTTHGKRRPVINS